MSIKAINKNGRSRVLRVNDFSSLEKIANRFDRWEYML